MSDLVERLRLQAEIGLLDAMNVPSHVVASYAEAADEIERLTAELASALAKVAQYEQAPVVGWTSPNQVQELKDGYDGFMVPISMDQFAIPLIARPEASHDST